MLLRFCLSQGDRREDVDDVLQEIWLRIHRARHTYRPGAPAEAGTYATAAARATEANREFVAIAHNFGWLPEGTKARYFAGITYEDLGQKSNAETELKAAAGSSDRDVANLAKLALAGLYRQTSRDNDAISLYNEIIAKPSSTVSASVAQLDLAAALAGAARRPLGDGAFAWARKSTSVDISPLVAANLAAQGQTPPVFVSPNVQGIPVDNTNRVYEEYERRLKR